jgi:hypothetical protein
MTDNMEVKVEDIGTFFKKSTRDKNDETNKIREKVLSLLLTIPKEYLEHLEFGGQWRAVYDAWIEALKSLAEKGGVGEYTSIQIKTRGGRGAHFDLEIMYYNDATLLATKKMEFKYGVPTIDRLPQFLSLQVKSELFKDKYHTFYYEKYLLQYLACDAGITEATPSLDEYLKCVASTSYSVTPFFAQLKERESSSKDAKNRVVNASIKEYLTQYASSIDIDLFSRILKETQAGKAYLLWFNGKFHYDEISESEMTDMTFKGVRKGNTIEVMSGSTRYDLLLRWRNHKGVLNPAWQIKRRREAPKKAKVPKKPKKPKAPKAPKAPKEPKKRQVRPKKTAAV